MAYRFKLHEAPGRGLQRIAREQIEIAARRLATEADTAVAIHEARKSLKRIRALLRMVRPGMTKRDFNRTNARFRDIARLLAAARDRHVVLATLRKLQASPVFADGPSPEVWQKLVGALQTHEPQATELANITKARKWLKRARKEIGKIKLEPDGVRTLAAGLARTYEDCQDAFAAAEADPRDETLHEWRKTVQLHWRHMRLLSLGWPELFEARSKAASELSQLLGDDHDLSVVVGFLQGDGTRLLPKAVARRLVEQCRTRQAELRKAARVRGCRLLAESPAGMRRLLPIYWEAAQGITDEQLQPTTAAPRPAKAAFKAAADHNAAEAEAAEGRDVEHTAAEAKTKTKTKTRTRTRTAAVTIGGGASRRKARPRRR